jgi:mono/diheme cytochrome c family protein
MVSAGGAERDLLQSRHRPERTAVPPNLFVMPTRWLLLLALSLATAARAVGPDAAGVEFFETKIRPVLVENCHTCHSAKAGKAKGGLTLDSRAGALKGGDNGPVIVPGDPGKSRLVTAIGYTNVDLQMPPKGKLSEASVADVTAWIKAGAPWPDEPTSAAARATSFDLAKRKAEHWAWRPVRRPAVPEVRNLKFPISNPVDAFLLAKLQATGLEPAPPADKETLRRRATFDLTGLPPTPAEIDAFLADTSPDAFAKVIDRLLASPRFGERWSRHWLDLVRYAETRGHEFDYPVPNAHQYRDYVIRALNADVPCDRFVAEHIAGDLLSEPRRHPADGFNESILGTGFWLLGEMVHSPVDIRQDQADRLDNRIDVFAKAFLGLTVACARCHDHKYDAIGTKDYYALFGLLEGSSQRLVRFDTLDYNRAVAGRLAALRERYRPAIRKAVADGLRPFADRLADELRAAAGRACGDAAALPAGAIVVVDYARPQPGDWLPDDVTFGPGPERVGTVVLGADPARPIARVATTTAARFDPFWKGLTYAAGAEHEAGDLAFRRSGRTIRTRSFVLEKPKLFYRVQGRGRAFACVDDHVLMEGPLHRKLVREVKADDFTWVEHDLSRYCGERVHVEFTATGDEFAVAAVVQADGPPAEPSSSLPDDPAAVRRLVEDALTALADGTVDAAPDLARIADRLVRLPAAAGLKPVELVSDYAKEQAALLAEVRRESRLAPALWDANGVDEHVFIRGSHKSSGELVSRRFLEALAGPEPLAAACGSGRLELARLVTDPDRNPFVARVAVNRVWHHLFGRGLVASVDNFGVLGEPPSHPELLDWLADEFVRRGWSQKSLIRTLMLTRAYQMSSRPDPRAAANDPQNVLLHRANVRRLEGEAIRDALLAVSGRLDGAMFGPPVPVYLTPFLEGRGRPERSGPLDGAGRRSVYLAVRRNFPNPLLLAFDTPPPATAVGRRTVSNVPAQALILLNDPFVHEQTDLWARCVIEAGGPPAERIITMYRQAFGRRPTGDEIEACLRFVENADASAAWADLAHTLVNVKEFIFLR